MARTTLRRRTLPLVLLSLAILAGCASLRGGASTHAAVGTWNYVVEDTPGGDSGGTLVVRDSETGLTGEITSDLLNQTVPVEVMSAEDGQIRFRATFQNQGQPMEIVTEASVQEDGSVLSGRTEVQGYGAFDLRAERTEGPE